VTRKKTEKDGKRGRKGNLEGEDTEGAKEEGGRGR
jgi:hypothetical protein